MTASRAPRTAAARHLTVEDLAERCVVSTATVYGWNHTGDGPRYMRLGRHVRYRLRDVEAWEASREVKRDAS